MEIFEEIDIQEYLQAGYIALCFARLEPALDFVEKSILFCPVRYRKEDSVIECNIGDEETPIWIESGYFWERDHLFKRCK